MNVLAEAADTRNFNALHARLVQKNKLDIISKGPVNQAESEKEGKQIDSSIRAPLSLGCLPGVDLISPAISTKPRTVARGLRRLAHASSGTTDSEPNPLDQPPRDGTSHDPGMGEADRGNYFVQLEL